MATDKLLEVSNLSVAFKDGKKEPRRVVKGISYHLNRGETLGIVGESGSGKSVSTLALMGLLPKGARVEGEALLAADRTRSTEGIAAGEGEEAMAGEGEGISAGVDLLAMDEEGFRRIRGRRISMIFQEPMTSLNPVQKCGEQVMEMAGTVYDESKEESKSRVIELFKEVMLPRPEKIFDSYPHELSGGQKQRVMIAMALINRPDIIIADEPTTALDVTVQKTILELLKSLQQKYGISIIFITHDLGVIAQIANRIAVMRDGEIVEQGDAMQVLHDPQNPYTKGLLACRPPLDGRPERLPTVDDFLKTDSGEEIAEREERREEKAIDPETKQPSVLLSVRNLNVEYVLKRSFFGRPLQKLKAVDGISFDLYRGETLGLVGESGCGKSTLGRALLRLIDSRSEQITFDGQRLDQMRQSEIRHLRTKMQIIFQDPYSSLNPRLTAGETICEPLRVHKNDMRKSVLDNSKMKPHVMELMERVGLKAEWYDRYPHQFSGGQRQRICIARALILNPELVICDESVSALDVSVQAQVLNLLNELKEQFGYTYIFISHDLSVVHFVSDRIMVMKEGRIIEHGNTDEIYHAPKEEYTRKLLEAIPRID